MRYGTAAAFRAALEARLNQMAGRDDSATLHRLRKRVVYERLLARLLVVAPDRWVLKGAVALEFRLGDQARPTKDLDLGRPDDEAAATDDLLAAQVVDLGDFFSFAIERTRRLDQLINAIAVRYRVRALLDGRRFEEIGLDIGLDALVDAPAERLSGSPLLAFAEIQPIEAPVLPLAYHLAEKVHAYTGVYPGGRPSTRVKDLIDLVLIRRIATFDAGALRGAFRMTFSGRSTQPLPMAFPLPPADWAATYRTLATDTGLDPDVLAAHRLVAAFLDPVLGGEIPDDRRWNPAPGAWL